ncbi:MAG: PaaI family thioesterase, partial [Lachnospiraceae bacterium]|nr:PaaI family thioesterase [Lachnospiraceae bacterium]
EKLTVTTTSNISYFAQAKGEALFSECRVVKDGKRNCFAETTITDSRERVVARVTTCGMHLN